MLSQNTNTVPFLRQQKIYTRRLSKTRLEMDGFFRMAALLVVAIARYVASSRLASQKNPSVSNPKS
jgi:hypothetical protein